MFVSIRFRKTSCLAVLFVMLVSILAVVFTPKSVVAGEPPGVRVPIIMYHSILKDESQWGKYVLSPAELEKDIIYLKKNGYEAVFVSQLIDYVNNGTPLPKKPVIISFDDGDYNNLTYVYPLLKKYNFKATFSIVGKFAEAACEEAKPSPSYSCLDWQDISDLKKSGYVEFANHTYNMHCIGARKGADIKKGESYEDYRRNFFNDVFKTQDLLKENCGFEPQVFTYPYGFSSNASKHLVKCCGFKASFGVEEKMNYIVKGDKDCLYDLHRYNRPSHETTENFMKRLLSN